MMNPMEHVCYRVFSDEQRLGHLRRIIARFYQEGIDDAIHDGIIALVKESGDDVFDMPQPELFFKLTKCSRRYHSRIQRQDMKHGMVAGSGRIKGIPLHCVISMFNKDGTLVETVRTHPSSTDLLPESILLNKENIHEHEVLLTDAVDRVLKLMLEIIGDVDISDVISIRDGYTTGRPGIGVGLATTLGIHERTAQRRLGLFRQRLSEDKQLQQLLKDILYYD